MYVEGAFSTRGTCYPAHSTHATGTLSLSAHTISNHKQYLEYQAHRNFHYQYHRSFSPLVSRHRFYPGHTLRIDVDLCHSPPPKTAVQSILLVQSMTQHRHHAHLYSTRHTQLDSRSKEEEEEDEEKNTAVSSHLSDQRRMLP